MDQKEGDLLLFLVLQGDIDLKAAFNTEKIIGLKNWNFARINEPKPFKNFLSFGNGMGWRKGTWDVPLLFVSLDHIMHIADPALEIPLLIN